MLQMHNVMSNNQYLWICSGVQYLHNISAVHERVRDSAIKIHSTEFQSILKDVCVNLYGILSPEDVRYI